MIDERFMFEAKSERTGHYITGYLFKNQELNIYAIIEAGSETKHVIDIETVTPVSVRPIDDFGFFCPNCNKPIIGSYSITKFCQHCGQAIKL